MTFADTVRPGGLTFATPTPGSTSTYNYVERCRGLEERLAAAEQQLRDSSKQKSELDAEASELRGQQKILREENDRLQQEIYLFKSSREGAGISARLAGLEQLVKEKDEAMSRMDRLVEEARSARGHLDTLCQQLRAQIQSLEQASMAQQQEMGKANDAIRRLQDDLRAAKSKVKSAQTLAQEQERLRRETQTQYEATKSDLAALRQQYEDRIKGIGELEEARRQLTLELEEQKRMNEGNEKVIGWLHRQISDEKLTAIIEKSFTGNAPLSELVTATPKEQPSLATTGSSEYPLANELEARRMLEELRGGPIGPETSLPRFTPEELALKQPTDGRAGGGSGADTDEEAFSRLTLD